MPEEDVEVVLSYVAAYSAQDLDLAPSLCARDVMTFPDRSIFPEAEPLAGHEALRTFLEETWTAWTSGVVTPRETRDLGGGRVLVRTDWDAQGLASGAQVTTNLTALYTVRGGRITRQGYFFDHVEAVKAAGLEE
jgi:ketosteroid isomerase-like protein